MRALSMATFAGAIGFTAAAARSTVSPKPSGRADGLAAVLVACSVVYGLQMAATVRPYALLMMFAAMSLWADARANPSALLGSHLLGLFTHPIFVFLTAASSIAGAAFGRGRWIRAGAPAAALGVYLLTWGWMLGRTAALPATSWMAAPGARDLLAGVLFWGDHGTPILAALIVLLTALRGFDRIGRARSNLAFAAAVCVLVLGLAFIVSQAKPVYLASRTPVLVLPAAAMAVGVFVSESAPLLAMCAVAALVSVSAVRFTVRAASRPDPFPTRASLASVAPRMQCGDSIVAAGLSYAPIIFYAPAAGVPACVPIVAFPVDVQQHPGWLDLTEAGRTRVRREADAMIREWDVSGTTWAFIARHGVGAEAGAALADARSRVEPSRQILDAKGSFFDEIAIFGPIRRTLARP